MTSSDMMRDSDIAKLIGVSIDTFQRRVRHGFEPGELDFSRARPMTVGGRRFWLRDDVERIIRDRVTKEESHD